MNVHCATVIDSPMIRNLFPQPKSAFGSLPPLYSMVAQGMVDQEKNKDLIFKMFRNIQGNALSSYYSNAMLNHNEDGVHAFGTLDNLVSM